MASFHPTPRLILVVEDEALIRDCTVSELESAGFAVIAAGNAQEALVKFEGHADVGTLFTDINMPGEIDGLSLAHMISELRPDVQLIITSGLRPAEGRMPARGHFLMKPYDCAAVSALMNAA
jgi:CheY-like chemotaxis protein